ncbi:uncharacterized protein LOC135480852 [Liolophura sinensis]|uniref:uncharacterized protein LOC135480852 n=1 Tax=Liolophura sinensis TaxID=3198878 RepID=UPI0031593729
MGVNKASVSLLFPCILLMGYSVMSSGDKVVYQLTVETCGTRLAGTESDVIVSLFNKTGAKSETTISGKGGRLDINKTDIYYLTSKDAEDLGPVCKVRLHLTNTGSQAWALRRLTVRHSTTSDVGTFGRISCPDENKIGEKPVTYKRNEPADPWKVWGECNCETRTRRRLPDPCRDAGGVDDEKTCTPDKSACGENFVSFKEPSDEDKKPATDVETPAHGFSLEKKVEPWVGRRSCSLVEEGTTQQKEKKRQAYIAA